MASKTSGSGPGRGPRQEVPLPPRHSSGVPVRPSGPVGTVEPWAGPSLFVRPWRGGPRRPAPAAQPSVPASPQQTRPLGDPRPPPASPPPSVTDAAAAAPRTAGPVTPPLPRPPRPHGRRPRRRSVGGAPGLRSGSARGPALQGRARIYPAAERPDSRPGVRLRLLPAKVSALYHPALRSFRTRAEGTRLGEPAPAQLFRLCLLCRGGPAAAALSALRPAIGWRASRGAISWAGCGRSAWRGTPKLAGEPTWRLLPAGGGKHTPAHPLISRCWAGR